MAKNIELEMKGIPLELRQMRMQKYQLGQEINKLTSEKFRTIEATNKSKREIISLGEELKKLQKKTSEIRALHKDEGARLVKVTKEIDKKLEEPELLNTRIDEKQKKLTQGIAKLDQSKAEHKDNQEALEQERTGLKRQSAELAKKNIEAMNNNVELKKIIASYNQKIADLDLQKDKVALQLDKAKGLNITLATKIKKADDDNILLKEKVKANDRQTNLLEAQKDQYEKKLIELVHAQKETEATQANYEKALAELEGQRKEHRLRELKFAKLVRDKNMTKELEELEKQNK